MTEIQEEIVEETVGLLADIAAANSVDFAKFRDLSHTVHARCLCLDKIEDGTLLVSTDAVTAQMVNLALKMILRLVDEERTPRKLSDRTNFPEK